MRRVVAIFAVAGCAVAQNTILTTLPCFGDDGFPVPCTFALSTGESNKAAFALGGGSFGGGLGTQFGTGTFGGGVVTTTTTLPVVDGGGGGDVGGGGASGEGEAVVEETPEDAFTCMSLIPLDDPEAEYACAQFIYNNNPLCCTCVNPMAVSVGEKIQFSADSNCTSTQIIEDIKDNVEFNPGNVSGTVGVCLEQCCTQAESPTALVFEVKVDIANQESQTRKVCTEMRNSDCVCAPASIETEDEEEVPTCEDNTVITILIVVFSVIVFIVLALAVYFIIKRDEDGDDEDYTK